MSDVEISRSNIDRLEQQMGKLLALCEKLHEENRSLQARQEALVAERAALVAKNEQARSRVEAMISRLRALEQA